MSQRINKTKLFLTLLVIIILLPFITHYILLKTSVAYNERLDIKAYNEMLDVITPYNISLRKYFLFGIVLLLIVTAGMIIIFKPNTISPKNMIVKEINVTNERLAESENVLVVAYRNGETQFPILCKSSYKTDDKSLELTILCDSSYKSSFTRLNVTPFV